MDAGAMAEELPNVVSQPAILSSNELKWWHFLLGGVGAVGFLTFVGWLRGGGSGHNGGNSQIIELETEKQFLALLHNSEQSGKLVIAEVYAEWEGIYENKSTIMSELAENYKESLILVRINVDDFEDLVTYLQVQMNPSYCLFKGQRLLTTVVGENDLKLRAIVEKIAGKGPPEEDDGIDQLLS
eukprot:TRINITY_DN18022_c0_g1_i1.p1 TRINITY_DN18022_c0_g1~~TRINITY_DN18022_c0_g1_i1.p1  ORF type:complete len:184 (-),score=34.52 TRINITY_DN18022_c0_g1_i1:70-621(-)